MSFQKGLRQNGMYFLLFLLFVLLGNVAFAEEKEVAIDEAKTLIAAMPLSYRGLVDHLRLGGYSAADAEFAASNCGANWSDQAVRSARNYRQFSGMDDKMIEKQLKDDGFTDEEIHNALNGEKPVSNEEAKRIAGQYLNLYPYSSEGLSDQLEKEGVAPEEAREIVDSMDINWQEQAKRSADQLSKKGNFTEQDMIESLEEQGFTEEQAESAAQSFDR